MDRLIEAIAAKDNPSIVGLDPTESVVPPQVISGLGEQMGECETSALVKKSGALKAHGVDVPHAPDAGDVDDAVGPSPAYPVAQVVSAFYDFNRAIIDAVKDVVPAVKPQIAMYEAYGSIGIDIYRLTCEYARKAGLYVLGDIKRGDIGSTAAAYAKHLTGINHRKDDYNGQPWAEDAVTVNPYFGTDGITPFIDAAAEADKDVFALVRTSNPSSKEIQELELARGGRLYEHVADLVEGWGSSSIGSHGYSCLAAVVGATHPKQGRELRRRMPHTFFLVPGYGAQGGTAADVAGMFDSHASGAVVNSSRGIIGAWRKSGEFSPDMNREEALDLAGRSARAAAIAMRDALNETLRG